MWHTIIVYSGTQSDGDGLLIWRPLTFSQPPPAMPPVDSPRTRAASVLDAPAALAVRLFGAPALPTPPPLTDQAAAWADHVLATQADDGPSLPPAYVVRKALDAVAFSLAHGLRDLSVPSKLIGVKAHQHAVEALTLDDQRPVGSRPRLTVSHAAGLAVYAVRSDGSLQPVGRVQPKHAAWLTPLLRAGAAVHLLRITGLGRRARGLPTTLGVNVRVAVWPALDARPCTAAEPAVSYDASGGGERTPALAVRLWRDADGTARMSCPHVVRHSPSGPEWGYGGSGPADCARSVLLALTDEATADAHYQDFKADVIARLPEHGAVIQRTVALAWLAGRAEAVTQRTA